METIQTTGQVGFLLFRIRTTSWTCLPTCAGMVSLCMIHCGYSQAYLRMVLPVPVTLMWNYIKTILAICLQRGFFPVQGLMLVIRNGSSMRVAISYRQET